MFNLVIVVLVKIAHRSYYQKKGEENLISDFELRACFKSHLIRFRIK